MKHLVLDFKKGRKKKQTQLVRTSSLIALVTDTFLAPAQQAAHMPDLAEQETAMKPQAAHPLKLDLPSDVETARAPQTQQTQRPRGSQRELGFLTTPLSWTILLAIGLLAANLYFTLFSHPTSSSLPQPVLSCPAPVLQQPPSSAPQTTKKDSTMATEQT